MKKSILKYFKAFTLIGIMASVAVLSSCGEDDGGDPPVVEATENLLQLIESTDGLDSLHKYITRYPSLTAALSASGEYTFFAPNNAAFVSLLQIPGFPKSIELINPAIIEGVMAYHIVSGEAVLQADFTASNTLTSLYTDAGSQTAQTISFNADGTLLTGSSNKAIEVETADIDATNGVMHVTKSVLIPLSVEATLTPILGTNAGTLLLGTDFTILASGIASADAYAVENSLSPISATLAGANKHTVFAPTNATFAVEPLASAYGSFSGETWYGILLNSIVVGDDNDADTNEVIDESEMTTGATFTTAVGGSLFFVVNKENAKNGIGVFIDSDGNFDGTAETLNAEVALVNAAPSANGTVHVIAGLCTPATPQ